MLESNEKEHKLILSEIDKLCLKFDNLDKVFPTRIEYSQAERRITALENIFKGGASVIAVSLLGAIIRLILK